MPSHKTCTAGLETAQRVWRTQILRRGTLALKRAPSLWCTLVWCMLYVVSYISVFVARCTLYAAGFGCNVHVDERRIDPEERARQRHPLAVSGRVGRGGRLVRVSDVDERQCGATCTHPVRHDRRCGYRMGCTCQDGALLRLFRSALRVARFGTRGMLCAVGRMPHAVCCTLHCLHLRRGAWRRSACRGCVGGRRLQRKRSGDRG